MSTGRVSRSWSLLVVRGRATGVSTRILSEVFGSPTSISEVEFSIGDIVINVRSKDGAFLVQEGDEVTAVGRQKERKLEAIGWWNDATQKGRKPNGWIFWPALAVAVVAGAALLGTFVAFDSVAMWRVRSVWGVLTAFAAVAASSGFFQRRARCLLDDSIAAKKQRKPRG